MAWQDFAEFKGKAAWGSQRASFHCQISMIDIHGSTVHSISGKICFRRILCGDGVSKAGLECMGVLTLLLDLQSAARMESAKSVMLALLEAVLKALHALLQCSGCPVHARRKLAASGALCFRCKSWSA